MEVSFIELGTQVREEFGSWKNEWIKHPRLIPTIKLERWQRRSFPGGPVAYSLSSQCRGPGFDPWSEN